MVSMPGCFPSYVTLITKYIWEGHINTWQCRRSSTKPQVASEREAEATRLEDRAGELWEGGKVVNKYVGSVEKMDLVAATAKARKLKAEALGHL